MSEYKSRSPASFGASNLRRSTATSRSKSPGPRSKSPGPAGPWIPPPGKASKGGKISWQVRIRVS